MAICYRKFHVLINALFALDLRQFTLLYQDYNCTFKCCAQSISNANI